MNVKLIVKKLMQNLRTERRSLGVNLCILAVAFLSVTVVVTMLVNLGHAIRSAEDHFQLTVYLKDQADQARTDALIDAIGKFPEVRSVKYVSKQAFRDGFVAARREAGEDDSSLGEEIFPATLQVKLSPEFMDRSSASAIVGKLGQIDIVEDVGYHESWLKNLSGALKLVWAGCLVFAVLVLLSSLMAMSNMIQLAFSQRAKAIRILRLNGATNAYIGVPVLLEGTIVGLVACLLSLGATWAAVAVIQKQVSLYLQGLIPVTIHFIPPAVAAGLMVLCALTGLSGAWLASRKVLSS
jgi:cell division transport system permease protein